MKTEKVSLRHEGARESLNLRPEKADLRSGRADFRPERLDGVLGNDK